MLSRKFLRAVAIVLVAVQVGSCAEIDRRGGIIDQIEDWVLFRADTKSHRLLRSYLLATVLLTAARRQGHNDVDRTAIAGALIGTMAVANEAYICLYPGLYEVKSGVLVPKTAIPAELVDYGGSSYAVTSAQYDKPKICQFFDERMARLDYALYRLAEVTLFNEESRKVLGDIRTKLIGKIPVLSDAAVAAIHANKAVNQLTTVLDDLLNLAFNSFGPVLSLLPLYRDSLELNMWVIADNLRIACKAPPGTAFAVEDAPASYSFATPGEACRTFEHAMYLLQRGNGDLRAWREFTRDVSAKVREDRALQIEAYRPHFLLVTQLLVRSCRQVLADAAKPLRCDAALAEALEMTAYSMNNATGAGITNVDPVRNLTASLHLPGKGLVANRVRRIRPSDQPTATGSIGPQLQQQRTPQAPPAIAPPPVPPPGAPPR
jgi:hypothetical protein